MNTLNLVRVRAVASVLAAVVILGSSSFLHAQVAGATLSGSITDPSGSSLPGAQVSVVNVATGIEHTVAADSAGFYIVPNLVPAQYHLTVTAKGFVTSKAELTLTVGANQSLDFHMKIGAATEKVEVTTEAPTVQLTSSDLSAVVNATTVRELPLNGRSWTDLATLQAGVDNIQTQPTFATGADRGNRGFGQQLTISGARPQQNNYRLDGISLNDYANGGPGSVLGGNLGVDAIQEFSVLTGNYSAEYGKTSGGVVNAVTRSGTNSIHGSAYEFIRNSAVDARNFFDQASIPPFKRNQFGGAVGGPIIKNKAFFFADYEGIRQSKGISALTTVPSLNARQGILVGVPPFTVDPAAAAYLAFYHLPNGPTNGDTAKYTFAGQQIVNENFVTARIDHHFSDKDSIFGTYVFDRTPYSSPDGVNDVLQGSLVSRQIAALEWTHLFGTGFANTVRLGLNHERVDNNSSVSAIVPAAADTSLGAFAGRTATQVFISGITPFLGGVGGEPTYFYRWNTLQVYDDALMTRNKHTIKFGLAVEPMRLNIRALSDPNGIWTFDTLQDFLTNNPTKFQGGIVSSVSPRNERTTLFGAYVQDDWRWKPNLTLNLGLRYEMNTVLTETRGKIANLAHLTDQFPVCGTMVAGLCGSTGPFFNNPTFRNFEPRFGFAWDPSRNGKTAVRGGIGLFDVLPLPYQFTLLTTLASPFFQYTVVKDPGSLCTPTCQHPFFNWDNTNVTFPANKLRATYIEPNPKRNYVMQWNLNVQQQLAPNLTAMVAYVGSRGIHQPFRDDDVRLALPTLTSAGYVFPFNPSDGSPLDTFNEHFGSIRGLFYRGHSYYNALETQISKRMSHGFQVQGVFTWAKSVDTSSATMAGDSFGNSISSLPFYNIGSNRGLSDFNIGRTLVINGTWDVPSPKSFSGPAKWATDGWELGIIFTANDGVPFTPTWGTGNDPSNTNSGDDWAFVNRLGGAGCKSLTNPGNPNNYIKTQCFSVPTAPNPAFWSQFCNPRPNTLVDSNGKQIVIAHPADPSQDNLGWLPPYPCFNLRGNAGRNIIIGPGLANLDFSVFKNNHIRRISENFNVQFRAEIFNIINHTNFAPPITPDNTDIFDGTGNIAGAAPGLLTRTTTTARELQFAVKIIW